MMTPDEMLTNLDQQGGRAAADFNDDDLNGWFGWEVVADVLTVTFELAIEDGSPNPKQSASWRLVPVEETSS